MRIYTRLTTLLAFFALAACGGSGGGGSDSSSPGTPWDAAHLVAIAADGVQGDETSDPSSSRVARGDGVRIGVLDVGFVPQHEQLEHRASYHDAAPDDPTLEMYRDHGTGVASLAAGRDLGVAPAAELILVDVGEASPDHPRGSASPSAIVDGLDYLRTQDVDVVVISLALSALSSYRDALAAGIAEDDWVVVIAAGEGGGGLEGIAAEAGRAEYDGHLMVVGSYHRVLADISPESARAYVQATGETAPAFLLAPGEEVCTAGDDAGATGADIVTCDAPAADGADGAVAAYQWSIGTSWAAPQVAGAAAAIRRVRPDMTGDEVVQALLSTATDLGDPGYDSTTGAGLLHVQGALDVVMVPQQVD